MAKTTPKTTGRKTTARNATTGKMAIQHPAKSQNPRTLKVDTGGVVAYTQGSRFKDAEVLAVVKRVLSQS